MHIFSALFVDDGSRIVARCIGLEIVSQAETKDEAIHSLREAIALHLSVPLDEIVLTEKPQTWDGFFEALAETEVPDDFLSPEERHQPFRDRDPFEGWQE